jgi:hypothetical protein
MPKMPNNYAKVIISLYTKKPNVCELTAGRREFDGWGGLPAARNANRMGDPGDQR